MKLIILPLMSLMLVLVSCIKKNTPDIPVDNTVDTTVAIGRVGGTFMNGPYGSVSGMAKIYQQGTQYTLALEGVSISNGPDLHVYLSKEVMPLTFIDLGRLQSVSGNQLYSIPGNPDFSQYRYALIHCKQYNHLFGSAELR